MFDLFSFLIQNLPGIQSNCQNWCEIVTRWDVLLVSWITNYFKEKISRTIDQHLTFRKWLIGFYIVEFEQNGDDRASLWK